MYYYINDFIEDKAYKYTQNTISGYTYDLNCFMDFLMKHENLEGVQTRETERLVLALVKPADIISFVGEMKDKNSKSAINRKLSSIKNFFRYLYSLRLITADPAYRIKQIKQYETQKTKELLSKQECLKLLDSISGRNRLRDKTIIMLMMFAAMTPADIIKLNISDINENDIILRDNGQIKKIIPKNDALRSILSDYLNYRYTYSPEDPLFVSGENKRISIRTIHQLISKHMINAGFYTKGDTGGIIRRSGAALLMHYADFSTSELMVYLGHKNLSSTQNYIIRNKLLSEEKIKKNPLASYKEK